ncbi:MAG TPA: fatty acid desaturase [Rhizomicrobium sp.]|jgi:beta-carotene hydroxylase
MDREFSHDMAGGMSLAEGAQLSGRDAAALERARAFEKRARGTVQHLSQGFPWPTILVFLGVLSGLAAMSALVLTGWFSYWAAIPVNAVLLYYIFTPLHEAVHGNIAGRDVRLKWLESIVGHISGFLLLAPYPGFRALHLHHHANTNDPAEDPDYWVKSDTYLGMVLRALVIQPVYILHLWKIARDPGTKRAFFWEMVYVVSYIPIVLAAYRLGFGNTLMLLWILPGYIGVVLCPIMFDWPVHHPHSGRGRYVDTAVLLFPRPLQGLMDVVFAGHSYHLMHHLYPRLPFYRYGAAWYALKDELTEMSPLVRDFSH